MYMCTSANNDSTKASSSNVFHVCYKKVECLAKWNYYQSGKHGTQVSGSYLSKSHKKMAPRKLFTVMTGTMFSGLKKI